jgi:light-regulated signal transduction histidine kinase (bacteriophytochrome)/ActR/RegA family two-component response regulator
MKEPVDLTNCDREPIHIPGAVQPHGVLVACRPEGLLIEQVSENVAAFVGVAARELLGTSILGLFAEESGRILSAATCLERPREVCPLHLTLRTGRTVEAILHRAPGEILVVELEPGTSETLAFHPQLRRSVARLQGAQTPVELCRIAVNEVRSLTGFDRVMAYRFDAEWNGEVIAEARRADLEPYLGLHYPASDIPAQARRLYETNWLRLIVDVNYTPSPLVPTLNPRTGAPLDMSQAVVRSVSPIHCEYLRNMGVGASMSISLLGDGKLVGLIACHHYSGAKLVPYVVRDSCEFLAQSLSWHLSSKTHAEQARLALATAHIEGRLLESMANAQDFLDGLATPTLLEVAEAQGAAVVYEGAIRLIGETPDEADVRELAAWLGGALTDGRLATDNLRSQRPGSRDLDDRASGLLAVAISQAHGDFVMWFRPSTERVIDWAGENQKDLTVKDGVARLSPRGSFALWRETIRGRSLPWESWQVAAASNLRRAILGGVRRRAAELRTINEQLTAADRAKDVFIATVSHELRTPLNAITGWVKLLLDGHLDDKRRTHALQVIQRNAQSQAHLIEDLIDISRLVGGKLTLNPAPLSIENVLNAALEVVSLAADAKSVTINKLIEPIGTTVVGDAHRLQQVIWNLLSNAIKFTPKGGKVDVRMFRIGSEIELSFTDSGDGIDRAFLPHVFELFRQSDDRLSRERRGLGIGLAIARHIIEGHGGRIEAESEGLGKGATFRLHLPINATAVDSDSTLLSPKPTPPNRELEGVRILVVEDEEDSREMLLELLVSCGAIVEGFVRAEDALERIAEMQPDLVISDIGLPGIDGIEFISRLRSRGAEDGGHIPAIALTAHTRSKDRTQALLAGFLSHVPKPLDPSELLAVVVSMMGRRKKG